MSKAKMENRALPKRFYAAASVQQNGAAFSVMLDGKPVRTPGGNLLQCASQQLAEAIAREWGAQGEVIDTDTMPLTRLLHIALDRAAIDRAAWLTEIANYVETDLLFYRAPHTISSPLAGEPNFFLENLVVGFLVADTPHRRPQEGVDSPSGGELRKRQDATFDPILAWIAATFGAAFVITEGLMPVPQPAASVQKIAAEFAAANDHQLAALAMMVPLLGSALLALAVWQGALDVEAALTAARLDETVQAEKWGEDAETVTKWAARCRDVRAASFSLTGN